MEDEDVLAQQLEQQLENQQGDDGGGGGEEGEDAEEQPANDLGPNAARDQDPTTIQGVGYNTMGCSHYRRRCKIVAPCCGEVHWCRHCHNQAKNDDEADPKLQHEVVRTDVAEVVCARCDLRQPQSQYCTGCGVCFGVYYCGTCKFWEDSSRGQYHCEKCGICRVGGRRLFWHCDRCSCCFHRDLQSVHKCVQDVMRRNCGVCQMYLFESRFPLVVPKCGHVLHRQCLNDMLQNHLYRCPTCQKTMVDIDWTEHDLEVEGTAMPEEYREWRSVVLCNDCATRSTVPFHVLGHRCRACGSYNTAVLSRIRPDGEEEMGGG